MIAAADILSNGIELLILYFLDSAGFFQSVYQTSSQSADEWPRYSISRLSKIAAVTIFEIASDPACVFLGLKMYLLVCVPYSITIG